MYKHSRYCATMCSCKGESVWFFFLNNISQLTAPSRGKALSVDFFFYYLVPPSPATFHCEQRATKKKKRMLIDYSKNPEYTFDLHSHAHKKKADTGILGTSLVIISFQQILLFFWFNSALFRTKGPNLLWPCSSFCSGGSRFFLFVLITNAKTGCPTGCVTNVCETKGVQIKKNKSSQLVPSWTLDKT